MVHLNDPAVSLFAKRSNFLEESNYRRNKYLPYLIKLVIALFLTKWVHHNFYSSQELAPLFTTTIRSYMHSKVQQVYFTNATSIQLLRFA